MEGHRLARWFAAAMVGLNAIGRMLFIPACPFWSLMIITVDVVAFYWSPASPGSTALNQLHIAQNVLNAVLYAALTALAGIAVVAVGGGGIKTISQRWEAAAA
jgi:hypothetical protein